MTITFTNAPANTRCGRCGTFAAKVNGNAIHTDDRGRHYCATHTPFPLVDLIKVTDICSRCPATCAATTHDIDPLCTACLADLRAKDCFPDLADNNPIMLANIFADSRILLGEPIIDRYYDEEGSWTL